MADNTNRYGFRWRKSINGAGQPKPIRYRLASGLQPTAGGTNVDFHVGDPVKILSTGYADMAVGSEGTQTAIYGIAVGFSPEYDGVTMQPRNKHTGGQGAYGTNYERENYVWVVPAEGQIFEVDCDDNTTATTYAAYLAFIGENADMVLSADTTNSNDPKANPKLDISSHATTSTLQWRILDIGQTLENADFSGNYVKLLVTINKTAQAPFQTTGT